MLYNAYISRSRKDPISIYRKSIFWLKKVLLVSTLGEAYYLHHKETKSRFPFLEWYYWAIPENIRTPPVEDILRLKTPPWTRQNTPLLCLERQFFFWSP